MKNKFVFKPHLIALAFLGFNSGFAFILFNSTIMMALSFSDFSTVFISGLFASSLPYALKVLWSPLMDYYAIPVLSKILGQRRSWLLVAQLGLFISSLGFIIKPDNIWLLSLISTIFVFFAATQDIALDAYRIERLDPQELATGTTCSITGFRVGFLAAGMIPLYLLKTSGWSIAFISASITLLIGPFITLMVQEPTGVRRNTSNKLPSPMEHLTSVYKSFVEFLQRPDWYLIILLIFFYKIGDSVPNAMKGPLLASLDFTPIETANISQAYGTILMIFGGFLGGLLVTKLGIFRSIIVGGSVQLLSPCMHAWLAVMRHNIPALIITTTVHNIACGLGSTILVIYVSSLCKKSGTTATQFALIYSFSSLTRTILSSASGICAAYVDWSTFFVCTTLIGLPVFFIIKKLTPTVVPINNAENCE
jgi:MFS family permease